MKRQFLKRPFIILAVVSVFAVPTIVAGEDRRAAPRHMVNPSIDLFELTSLLVEKGLLTPEEQTGLIVRSAERAMTLHLDWAPRLFTERPVTAAMDLLQPWQPPTLGFNADLDLEPDAYNRVLSSPYRAH